MIFVIKLSFRPSAHLELMKEVELVLYALQETFLRGLEILNLVFAIQGLIIVILA